MEKPTAEALSTFDAVFPSDERAQRKRMFGMPAGFVHGNMFLGVWANGIVLRVGESRRDALASGEGVVPFEPMEGRPWKEYVLVDVSRRDALPGLTREALEHTATLPPKEKKPRGKKA